MAEGANVQPDVKLCEGCGQLHPVVVYDEEWERTQDGIMALLKADPANWKEHPTGHPYYVGPKIQNDGTIDWSGHDGWPG